jgi:oligopeptide transport system substrate-binding protein
MISDGTTAVQAYEAGEIDVNLDVPPEEIARLKETEDYQQYPTLGTYYYGLNVKNITDVNQRRAMALAIDRRTIIDNITQADEVPASGFTPEGMPGFDSINPESEWLPENGDMARAKELMSQVQNPKRDINLLINDAPGHREIAVAVQANWAELGLDVTIRQQEWAQFLEAIGPPPSNDIDAFRLGWIADWPDAMNFLELWTSDSGNNSTNSSKRHGRRPTTRSGTSCTRRWRTSSSVRTATCRWSPSTGTRSRTWSARRSRRRSASTRRARSTCASSRFGSSSTLTHADRDGALRRPVPPRGL